MKHPKRILITGAGSGLGQALALRFAKHGAQVACVDIQAGRAQDTLAMLAGEGHQAFVADVSADDSMQALCDQVLSDWGVPDILINNAGIASGGDVLDAPISEWRHLWEVNVLSVVRGTRLFLPSMLKRGSGHIVNTASFAGLAGAPGLMTYGVSKAAVVAFSEQLRAECHGTGVDVSVICPAFFKTNLMQSTVGTEKIKHLGQKMMDRSPDSLDQVADRIFADIAKQRFLIIPTKNEPMLWRIKRFFPKWYYKELIKRAGQMQLRVK
ncbi:MAG: SDR family NAD(P)-dependent oxidoreductase [Arenimonas sp.]|nr:SDR family NAD(P)-dependent oxidoreductase [Arenimonas sp.]